MQQQMNQFGMKSYAATSYDTYGMMTASPMTSFDSSIDNRSFYYGKTSSPKSSYFQSPQVEPTVNTAPINYAFNYLTSSNPFYYNQSFNTGNYSYVGNDSAYQSSQSITANSEPEVLEERAKTTTKNKKRKLERDEATDELVNTTVNKKPKVYKLENFAPETKCATCCMEFNSIARYLMHEHKIHNNRSSTECPICYKKFGNQANTLVHLKAHTQEKTYKCNFCDNSFCDSSTLKKHLRTHTGERPFVCNICSKSFSQSGNLKRHLAVHEKYDTYGSENSQQTQSSTEEKQQECPNLIQPFDYSQYYQQSQQYFNSAANQYNFNFYQNLKN